jgi:hypothetical protein
MESLTIDEQNNNQLFLDLFLKQQELIRSQINNNIIKNKINELLEKTKGKHWIVEHEPDV